MGGLLVGYLNIYSTGLGGTVTTPVPPGVVSGGLFPGIEHEVIMNEGTLLVVGSGLFYSAANSTNELSEDPIQDSLGGTGSVDVVLRDVSGDVATYDLSMAVPVDVVSVSTSLIEVTTSMQGLVVATGTFARLTNPNVLCEQIDPHAGSGVELGYTSETGIYYQVQWRNRMGEGEWLDTWPRVEGTGGYMTWMDDGTATGVHPDGVTQRFYRVRRRLGP
jgi:hypothetical protein